jgi:hypothetical protein
MNTIDAEKFGPVPNLIVEIRGIQYPAMAYG